MIKKYALVVKQDEKSEQLSIELKRKLEGILEYNENSPDLIISIGGDGTLLYALHQHIDKIDYSYFLGIHTGTLGFYTDYLANEIDELVEDIKKGEYTSFNRSILDVEIIKKDHTKHMYALNEMRLENPVCTQVLNVYINDELLETYRGNGMCVSTSSGSTAYNKSLGGAVVLPDMDVMQLTEIAGIHHNAYRSLGSSIVLGKNHKITLESERMEGVYLGIDHLTYPVKNVRKVNVTISNHVVRCIQYRPLTFVNRIRRSFIV